VHLQQYIHGRYVREGLGLVACVRGAIPDETVLGFVQLSD